MKKISAYPGTLHFFANFQATKAAQASQTLHSKHYSLRTEEAYLYWIRWYIRFHGLRHPMNMGAAEVTRFLSYLTNERSVSVCTHKQALCALLFLYKKVLGADFPWLEDVYRPSRSPRLPTDLTEWEVSAVFAEMKGTHALMARLVYGTGTRLIKCMKLRVKDVDFGQREIIIREGKGNKDRITMLPLALAAPLRQQIEHARTFYEADCARSRPGVMLPDAVERKYSRQLSRGDGSGFSLQITSESTRARVSCVGITFTNRRSSVPSREPSRQQS